MAVQQAIDGAGSHRLLRLLLISPLDFGCRRSLPSGGTGPERLKEGAFLRECEVLVTPPAFPRGLDGSHPCLLVRGNDAVDGRGRDAHRPGNVLGLTRSRQRLIDDLPALTTPGALFPLHPGVHCVLGQMRGCARNAVSHQVVPLS